MQRAVQWRESDVGWPVKLHRVGLKSIEACYYEWPIRGQHSGHVISMDQSEARLGMIINHCEDQIGSGVSLGQCQCQYYPESGQCFVGEGGILCL